MASFTAALFVTQQRPMDEEHNLSVHALLFEGHMPKWNIIFSGKQYQLIPDPSFILEDCLLFIDDLVRNQSLESKVIEKTNLIDDLYTIDELASKRSKISLYLGFYPFHVKLIVWPGFGVYDIKERIAKIEGDSPNGIKIALYK